MSAPTDLAVPWWVTFQDGSTGCVEAPTEAKAITLASELQGRPATTAQRLPYPAQPRLNAVSQGDHGPCPSFCWIPRACAGRLSCPRPRSCDD
jgi:hypothetical protein